MPGALTLLESGQREGERQRVREEETERQRDGDRGGESERERVKTEKSMVHSPLEEQFGLNQHISIFVFPSFAVPPTEVYKDRLPKKKDRQRQKTKETEKIAPSICKCVEFGLN